MKRLLSLSLVSTPLAFVVLSLLSAQPVMADKFEQIGESTQWYWCAGTGPLKDAAGKVIGPASIFSDHYGIPIPMDWNEDDAIPPEAPMMTDDGYGIQLNYWNSVLSGAPNAEQGGKGGSSSKGYSRGVLCLETDTAVPSDNGYRFKIVIPPDPPKQDMDERDDPKPTDPPGHISRRFNAPWYSENPYYWNYALLDKDPQGKSLYPGAAVSGGPTGYPAIYLGCAWGEQTTCTPGSSLPWYGLASGASPGQEKPDTNPKILPRQLKHITSLPSSWDIDYDASTKPASTDPNGKYYVWDAAFDIWFDKTGDPNVGQSPYPPKPEENMVRGQNDGLEIMVWMDCSHCAPEALAGADPAAGYVSPQGWERERVLINKVVYIVWSGRLNNAYFGHTDSKVIPAGVSWDQCTGLPTDRTNKDGNSMTCGTNWNVVSFMAETPYQSKRMDMDAKVFVDYILGRNKVGDGMCSTTQTAEWCWVSKKNASRISAPGTAADGVLACPGSPLLHQWKDGQTEDPKLPDGPKLPIPCLSEDWVLTSVQAGFESWVNGVSLTTKNFKSYALVTSSAVQSGRTSEPQGPNNIPNPIVYWGAPFDVVFTGCAIDSTDNWAMFRVKVGPDDLGNYSYWPADQTYHWMNKQPGGQFTWTVPPLSPLHGQATIQFLSNCTEAPNSVAMFIDPSGRIVYEDGTTPVVGAKVTLDYSTTGKVGGPFEAVPNQNGDLLQPIMQPDDNTQNSMSTDKYGSYAWNVIPGYYHVKAEKDGCGSVTSPVQTVDKTPIMGLDLVLPCPPPHRSGYLGTTLSISSSWPTGGPNGTGGYCATIDGTNNTALPLEWTAMFMLPDGSNSGDIYSDWNMTYSGHPDGTAIVNGVDTNAMLAPGQSLQDVGFCAYRGPAYNLSVTKTGPGSGTVTSSPAGINCGSTCSVKYFSGTSVTLTATPAAGSFSLFAGWSGACSGTEPTCTITMSSNQSVTAAFNIPSYPLTVTKAGTGSGTVTSSPAGINCGSTCTANYTAGTSVTLTAAPAAGSTFAGWSGGGCSGSGKCTVTMSSYEPVTATFNASAGSVTVTPVVNPNTPNFTEEDIKIANTASLTALKVTIVMQRASGVSYSGEYNNVGSQITQANSSTKSAITYTFTLASGKTVGAGTNWVFAGQANGTGKVHPTTGDTYTVTYTMGGQTNTKTGHF